jgi:hypothetical protein
MLGVKTIFTKSPTKLFGIEQNDGKIDQELSSIIQDVENKLLHFCSHINENTLIMKEDRLNELQEELLPCKQDLEKLYNDIQEIINIKKTHQEIIIIKDSQFLKDKQKQIRTLQEEINNVISILEEHPSKEDLEHELIARVRDQLHESHDAIRRLIADDIQLQNIYQSLGDL